MALRRLVTSAATIAILGCSEGEVASPPPFIVAFPNPAPITQPAGTAGAGEQAPPAADPAPSADGSGAPAAGQQTSEGQNPDIAIANPDESGTQSGGSEAPTEMGTGAEPANGMEQPGAEALPPAEMPSEEPEPEEPEPIVRPALNCGAPAAALEGGLQACQANDQGSVSGQSWFLWFQGGSGCMTSYDNLSGAFRAQWNNPGDFLARIGFWFDETQRFDQLGEIGADLKFTRQGNAGGFSFIGIYGWTTNPLVEYYIVEDSFGNGPAQPFNTQQRGNVTVDGAQYNVYSGARQNLPNITGTNANFTQVLSVRQNPRQCGHVSISEHFRQWQRMGVNLGFAKEAKILVEAGGGNGSITFTHANITVTPPD